MGLFSRKKKKLERNEINNKAMKENLANTALGMLDQGQDYEQLDNLKCEFGYLFVIEGHGLESLFKITTDTCVSYFAAQGDSLSRVALNEEQYKSTTETFLSLHQ